MNQQPQRNTDKVDLIRYKMTCQNVSSIPHVCARMESIFSRYNFMCDYPKYVCNKFMEHFIYYHSCVVRNGDDVSYFQFNEMAYCSNNSQCQCQVLHSAQLHGQINTICPNFSTSNESNSLLFCAKKNFSGLNRFRTVVHPSNSQKFNGLTVRNNRSLIKIDSIGSKLWPQLRNG